MLCSALLCSGTSLRKLADRMWVSHSRLPYPPDFPARSPSTPRNMKFRLSGCGPRQMPAAKRTSEIEAVHFGCCTEPPTKAGEAYRSYAGQQKNQPAQDRPAARDRKLAVVGAALRQLASHHTRSNNSSYQEYNNEINMARCAGALPGARLKRADRRRHKRKQRLRRQCRPIIHHTHNNNQWHEPGYSGKLRNNWIVN
jgi:hypothetical protein